MTHCWFHLSSLSSRFTPLSSPASAGRLPGAGMTAPRAPRGRPYGRAVLTWLQGAAVAVLHALAGAWERAGQGCRWPGFPIEVLVSNAAERRALERKLRATLHGLRRAVGPLPPGRRVSVVVQHTLGDARSLASLCDSLQDAGGAVLFLIRLALYVHGRALPPDEVLAQLADRYISLVLHPDTLGAPRPVEEERASVADAAVVDPAASNTGEANASAEPPTVEASDSAPANDPAPTGEPVAPQGPARRGGAHSSGKRPAEAPAVPLSDPLGLRTSPPAPRPTGTAGDGVSLPLPPAPDATTGVTETSPAKADKAPRGDRGRWRKATD